MSPLNITDGAKVFRVARAEDGYIRARSNLLVDLEQSNPHIEVFSTEEQTEGVFVPVHSVFRTDMNLDTVEVHAAPKFAGGGFYGISFLLQGLEVHGETENDVLMEFAVLFGYKLACEFAEIPVEIG